LVKSLEILDLDAPAGSQASRLTPTPSGATPDLRTAEPWQDLLRDGSGLDLRYEATRADGVLHLPNKAGAFAGKDMRAADGAIRARMVFKAGQKMPSLTAREGSGVRYGADVRDASTARLFVVNKGGPTAELATFPIVPPLREGEDYDLELRAVGQTISVRCNGLPLGAVQDTSQAAGNFGIWQFGPATAIVKAFSYLPLNAAAASAEPWQDVLHDSAKLSLSSGVERTPEGLRFTDNGNAMPARGQGPQRDGAVRMLATFGGLPVQLIARRTDSGDNYQLNAADGKQFSLWRWDHVAKQNTNLRRFPLREPLQPGQDYELELRVVGQTLTVKLNGEILGTVTDGTFPEGHVGVAVSGRVIDHNAAPALIKALEVLDLDAPGGASITPAATTYPQPGAWIDATDEIRTAGLKEGVLVVDGDWLEAKINFWHGLARGSFGNVVVRIVFSNRVEVHLRHGGGTYYNGGITANHGGIGLRDDRTNSSKHLGDLHLGGVNVEGAAHELVFAAEGDKLSLWLDDKEVANARDGTLTAGTMELALFSDKASKARIKKVEYGELPDLAPAATRLSPSAEPWQDVLRDPAKLALSPTGVERTPDGLRFTQNATAMLHGNVGSQKNGAVRLRATFAKSPPQLRARAGSSGLYQLFVQTDKIVWLNRLKEGVWTTLRQFPLSEPLVPGQEYELELRVVGQTLNAKLNGVVLGTLTDATLEEGAFGVAVSNHPADPVLVKSLEVLDLDASAAAN
jgi:hypothetical protein